jgi:hypothetical protein
MLFLHSIFQLCVQVLSAALKGQVQVTTSPLRNQMMCDTRLFFMHRRITVSPRQEGPQHGQMQMLERCFLCLLRQNSIPHELNRILAEAQDLEIVVVV